MDINYEEEVKKVYPEAYSYIPEYFDVTVVKTKKGGIEIGKGYFADEAWDRAYENLKKQGKIS